MTRAPRLWFDVEDLFDFAERNARPTGIQRVCYEIYRAALADPVMRERVGFIRHDTAERGFVEADWNMLAFRFRHVTDRPAEIPPDASPREADRGQHASQALAPSHADGVAPRPRRWLVRTLRRAGGLVPRRVARPGFLFAVMQVQAGAALAATVRATVGYRARRAGGRAWLRLRGNLARMTAAGSNRRQASLPVLSEPAPIARRRLADIARRGDVLVVLGSPWFEADYSELAGHVRGRLGLRLAVLVHDVIPVRRPEWVDRGTVRVYRDWYRTVLPLADLVLANSRYTADDVSRWCARDNIRLNATVRALPIGTGFGPDGPPAGSSGTPAALPSVLARRLGGRPYVLFVSTIEARKNHLLLFRVWRRLLDELPPALVPDLVFAGRVGWLVEDLMNQIENSRHLDGRLHVIQGLDDASLRAVYENCRFTVFPSFYEGWGLPVSESLSMGRPCICSNATSLPEAGGTLARYFDPFDLNDATRVIREAIEDAPGLAAWRERVQQLFEPVGWDRTVAALLACVDEPG